MIDFNSDDICFFTSLDYFYNRRRDVIGIGVVLNNEELIKEYNSAILSVNTFSSDELFEKIFLNNLGFIYKIIRKKGVKQHETDDCLSYCSVEFVKCLQKYEVEKGYTFTTFLYSYLLKAIYLFYEQHSFDFYIPRHAVSFYYKYRKTMKENSNFSFDEAFKKINEDSSYTWGRSTAFAIVNALSYSQVDSTDFMETRESENYNSKLDSVCGIDHYAVLEKNIQLEYVFKTIKSVLNEREFDMVFLRYFENHTLESVGAIHEVSRERVRQIVATSLKKIEKVLKYEDLNF